MYDLASVVHAAFIETVLPPRHRRPLHSFTTGIPSLGYVHNGALYRYTHSAWRTLLGKPEEKDRADVEMANRVRSCALDPRISQRVE